MTSTPPPGGFYANPVRPEDMPDPDAIPLSRGGYGLVASSFDRRPGLPLWWSRDLVDWIPVGFAGGWMPLEQPSGGVWAPSLREHGGRLFITWADPDRGIFVVEAPALTGPWSPPRLIREGRGLIDPCPFWDADGSAWIVHGWARSRAGIANRLSLLSVDALLRDATGESRTIIDGDAIEGCTVLEGPKLYRRGGYYWIFAPAGGVETGWQYAFRARGLTGPWEARVVLAQGSSDTNGPHQGAWVEGVDGEEWFLHFQHTPAHGRILHLQPLRWGGDGWPLIGHAVAGGPAEPVARWTQPAPRTGGETPTPTLRWHGRGADPGDLLQESDDAGLLVSPGGALGLPLPRDVARIDVALRHGAGFLTLAGIDEHTVTAQGPALLSVTLDGGRARLLRDGRPAGEPFELSPPQWTGLEYAIGAVDGRARFDHPVLTR